MNYFALCNPSIPMNFLYCSLILILPTYFVNIRISRILANLSLTSLFSKHFIYLTVWSIERI